MNDYGASHNFSKHGRKKRRSVEQCPYSVTIKITDDDMNRLEELRMYLKTIMDDVSWENQSMLIRQAIKMATSKMLEDKIKIEEKSEIAIKV